MRAWVLTVAFTLSAVHAAAQTPPRPAAATPTPQVDDATEGRWSLEASAYTYIVPDDSNYVQPTLSADRKRLHLEARFNYEAIDTGSAWLGANFGGGDALAWTLVPMFGGVFGDTSGVAPGYHASLGWRKLEFYSEGEYVFDMDDSTGNFFYNWSEATFAPVESFWFGIVTQRTRAYQSAREIQRGLLVGFAYRRIEVVGHVFNPDDDAPTVVVAVRVSF